MQFDLDLAARFADAVLPKAKEARTKDTGATYYGTVTAKGENGTFVRLDGTPAASGIVTPVTLGVDAEAGDRVSVIFKNRQAIVTGNVSHPANYSVGQTYISVTSRGLKVGYKDGNYIVIGDDEFWFYDASGMLLATMKHVSGSGFVISKEQTPENPAIIQLQATNGSAEGILRLDSTGVSIAGGLTVGGSSVVKVNETIIFGQFTSQGTIGADKSKALTFNPSVPTGYQLAGLSSIEIVRNDTNVASKYLRLRQYKTTPTGNISVSIFNGHPTESRPAKVTVTWFAIKSDTVTVPPPDIITWPDEDED